MEQYGLFTFHESAENCIDIIAVHGLNGHYEDTWTWTPAKPNSGTPCNWLKDLLPNEIPNARIMSFGYNAAVAFSRSIGVIDTFAEQLLSLVLRERPSERQMRCPIIFVCHSLGGIIVKKAMMHANERRNIRSPCAEFLCSVKGILFMGTPHRGSGTASLGSICAEVLRAVSLRTSTNSTLIQQLREDSQTLQDISRAFASLGADVRIYTFYETDRMEGLRDPIVTQDSARLNVPNEDVIPLPGNHLTMCKYPGRTENYKTVSGVLEKFIPDPVPPIPIPPNPAVEEGRIYRLSITDEKTLTVVNLNGDVKLRPRNDEDSQQWKVETTDNGSFGFRNMYNGGLLGVNAGGWVGAGTHGLGGWESFFLVPAQHGHRFIVAQWWSLQRLPLMQLGDYLEVPRFFGIGGSGGSHATITITYLSG